MKNNRLIEMEKYIAEHQMCTMNELVNEFKVSMNTVRNDIKILVSRNIVKKVYGGVSSVSQNNITAFDLRTETNIEQKVKIAKEAAHFVKDDDVIFIDSGTTTMKILDFLDDDVSLTIITHNLNVINSCILKENIRVIALPGILDRKTRSFHDVETPKILEKYNIDKAFLAATSITDTGRLSNTSSLECAIKSCALEQSNQKFLLADSSKFNKKSLMTFGSLSDIDCLITDKLIDARIKKMCELNTSEVITV